MTLATEKWGAVWTSRGTVLTTELNSVGTGAYSAFGTSYDHTTNLDKWGMLKVILASLSPTSGASVTAFMGISLDGTTWENPPASTNPGWSMTENGLIVPVDTTAASAKLVYSKPFLLNPAYLKFALRGDCGVAFNASGNTVTLYTTNLALV